MYWAYLYGTSSASSSTSSGRTSSTSTGRWARNGSLVKDLNEEGLMHNFSILARSKTRRNSH